MNAPALEAIDWTSLTHADGPASDTPGHLRALLLGGPRAVRMALAKLEDTLHRNLATYPASAAAVPFIVAAALDPRRPMRAQMLHLLAGLAIGDLWPLTRQGFDARSEFGRATLSAHAGGFLSYEAVSAALASLVPLLTDGDAAVRTATAFLLACFVDRRESLVDPLHRALAREDDPSARASMLLSLRFLASPHELDPEVERWVAAADVRSPRVDAVAAAITLLALRGRHGGALRVLAKLKATKGAPGFGWGDLRPTARWVIDGLDFFNRPVPALLAEFEADATTPERRERILVRLLPLVLPSHDGSYHLPESLPPSAHRLLLEATKRQVPMGACSMFFHFHGVPPDDLAHWLGLSPPDLLRRLTAGPDGCPWPIWKWLHAAVKHEVSTEACVDALSALPPADRIELCYPHDGPPVVWRYNLLRGWDEDGPDDFAGARCLEEGLFQLVAEVLASCPWDDLRALAEAHVDGSRKLSAHTPLAIAVGRSLRRAERRLPHNLLPLWDRAQVSACLRDLFSTMTLEDREAILRRATFFVSESIAFKGGRRRRYYTLTQGWLLLDLCPTSWAAQFVTRAILDWQDAPQGLPLVVDVAVKLGGVLVPVLEQALADPAHVDHPGLPFLREILRRLR